MNSEVESRKRKAKPLGVYLVEAGLVSPTQVHTALKDQKVSGKRLGEILADQGWVAQQTIEYFIEKVVLPEGLAGEKMYYLEKNSSQKMASVGQASQAEGENTDSLVLSAVESRELQIHLLPKRTTRFLVIVVLGLVLASLVAKFTQYFLPDYPLRDLIAELTNLEGEVNIPALYSASALLFCSIILAIIAYAKKVAGDRYVPQWGALSIIFLYLSLDELMSIHERMIKPVRVALDVSGFLYFAWVIPGAAFVLICLLAFLRFLTHLPAKIRRLFLMAGSLFVGGAIVMEMVGGYHYDFHGSQNMTYVIVVSIEEFLEMLGISVFIYALLSYISSYMKGVSLRVTIIDDTKQR